MQAVRESVAGAELVHVACHGLHQPDNPLFKLANVITAPHLAGVTREALDRMGLQTAKNILSAFDGDIIRENVINKDVLG